MLNEYLYELIALSVVVITLLSFILIKKKNKKNPVKDLSSEKKAIEEETLREPIDDPQESTIIEDEYDDLAGSEEGDFGTLQEEIEEEKETLTPTRQIKKRSVPPHDKITKESFKEFEGERVLIAEDNLINQKVLLGLLGESGMDLIIANDGQEALDILEKDNDFLMVLMDAHMPRVDGFQATREIRKNPNYNHILVVALSGDTAADDIAKMREAGMAEQLEKPLRMEALYDILYAYTGDEEVEDSEYIEVIMTEELDGDKGLSICGGDEEFYHEILAEFVATYSDSDHKLHILLSNQEFKKADQLLLDILGVSANIGADKLNDIALKIKDSLSDTHSKSYISLMDSYTKHLKALLLNIKEYN